jgi:hypothetical protein
MTDLSNLLILFSGSVIFLYLYARNQRRFFSNFDTIQRPIAVTLLLMSSLAAAAVNLVQMSEMAANANRFFLSSGSYGKAILYSLATFAGTWLVSLLLFRLSYLIVDLLTAEKEKDELMKNNVELALLHGIILITISFVVSPLLVKIASGFIPYPDLPFR